jgi:tetratricopeptide (TPR) repeat protein
MAWRRLGIYATNPGQGPLVRAKGDTALRRAYALRDRLPERERLFVEAAYATNVEPDFGAVEAAYSTLIAKYPNDATALNNLGTLYERLGRSTDAIEFYRRAIDTRMAPSLTYANAVGTAGSRGHLAVADSFLVQLRRDFPQSSDLREAAINLATHRQDFTSVDSIAQVMLRGPPNERVIGHRWLAMLAALGGRAAEASRERRNAWRVELTRGQVRAADAELVAELDDIRWAADYTGNPAPLIRRVETLWASNTELTASRPRIMRRHLSFAMAFARLGAIDRARQIMDEYQRMMTDRDYPAMAARMGEYVAQATVSVTSGKPDEALARLREGCDAARAGYPICEQMAFFEAAEAHDKAGRADSAIAAYRRFVGLRALRQFTPPGTYDAVTPRIAPVWRRLGELLEAEGDKQQAMEAYEKFLNYWRNADPEFQPIVRDVRERVNRLRRATG